jgi:hypothetical protein
MVNQLHVKQMEMHKDAMLTKESSVSLAGSIANFITLDAQQVAKAVVNEKLLNKELDGLINAIKKDVENTLSDLGSGKVTQDLVHKVIAHIDTDEIAETISEKDIEEAIAQYIDAENVAYHIDVSDVAGYVSVDDVAGYIDHGDVASYVCHDSVADCMDKSIVAEHVDASDVAEHVEIDLDDLAGRIDLDALADLVKGRMS